MYISECVFTLDGEVGGDRGTTSSILPEFFKLIFFFFFGGGGGGGGTVPSNFHASYALYSASQKKGNPSIELIFQKTVMIYQKKFTLLQNSVYPLSFDTSYKMYWPCMSKHGPFQIVMSKTICARMGIYRAKRGTCHIFRTQGRVEKTFISISFVSFVMFLLLRLLILTWIS